VAAKSAEELAAIAEIKAENSRRHRQAQTYRNLLWALVASLLVVLFLVLVVVRPDQTAVAPVDYGAVAAQAQSEFSTSISAPALPPEWTANDAELRQVGAIDTWYIGFITPKQQFIALNQGLDANATWVDTLLDGGSPTGSLRIGTQEWTVYDHRDGEDPGNLAYALVTESGDSTFVLHGTASDVEFETLATAMEVD
jgi:hypothetical protein